MKPMLKLVDTRPSRIKIPLKFDISMLNLFIGYLFKKSTLITRKSLNNVKKLFELIDDRIYDGNEQLEARINFINKAIDAKLNKNFENESFVINHCRQDIYNEQTEEIIKNLDSYTKMNFEEIKFINNAVQDRLKYAYLLEYKDKIYSTVERLDAGTFNTFQEINGEMEKLCSSFLMNTRKLKSLDETTSFSLDEETYEESITDIVTKLKDPSRILKTGIQYLNQILAPGYMSKRLYTYLGLPA